MKVLNSSFLTVLAASAVAGSTSVPRNSNDHCRSVSDGVGAAFALTNLPDSNKVVAFSRDAQGKLTKTGIYPTGGKGLGFDFDTQGGLQLSSDNKYLYAVSPSDDKISVFSVHGSCLKRIQVIYGGDEPLSLTLHDDLLYVLDGSVAATGIRGYHRSTSDGTLSPIGNETIPTSTPIGVPGTILFHPSGKNIVVLNKIGSTIDFYSVDDSGMAHGPITTTASSGMRPFGAYYNTNGTLFVAESGLPVLMNSALSTYGVAEDGALSPITKSEKNQQTDGCWVVVTNDSQYAYIASFGDALSSYKVGNDGSVSLLEAVASAQGDGSEPVDLALSADSKYLYNLLRGYGAITAHSIGSDGSLTKIGVYGRGMGLPANTGASGLAAY